MLNVWFVSKIIFYCNHTMHLIQVKIFNVAFVVKHLLNFVFYSTRNRWFLTIRFLILKNSTFYPLEFFSIAACDWYILSFCSSVYISLMYLFTFFIIHSYILHVLSQCFCLIATLWPYGRKNDKQQFLLQIKNCTFKLLFLLQFSVFL